jgi:hypothetical protein
MAVGESKCAEMVSIGRPPRSRVRASASRTAKAAGRRSRVPHNRSTQSVGVVQVEGKRGSGWEVLQVLGQFLAAGAAALAELDVAVERLQPAVGSVHNADAAAGLLGERDDVPPQGGTMVLDVLEDDIDGLALVLSRPARGAALAKVGGQGLDGLANVTQSRLGLLGRDRLGRRVGGLRPVVLGTKRSVSRSSSNRLARQRRVRATCANGTSETIGSRTSRTRRSVR